MTTHRIITGNISQLPNPNDTKDNFHFKTGDGRIGCRFSVACGFGDNRYFVNVRVFDREAMEKDDRPDRFKHPASWVMAHAAKGTQIQFPAREEGEWRERQSSGAGWRRGNTGGGGKEYRGTVMVPTGVFELGAHSGERALLTAIRRNPEAPEVIALMEYLTSDADDSPRIGSALKGEPAAWEQLREVEAWYAEVADKGSNNESATADEGSEPSGDTMPEADDEDAPF